MSAPRHGVEPHLHPEHFTLSPEVAQLPLARRRQRLGAILIDLLIVLAISNVFSSLGILTGAAVGTLLYWASGRSSAPEWLRQRSVRVGLAFGLCMLVVAAGRWVKHEVKDEDAEELAAAAQQLGYLKLDGKDLVQLATTKDPDAARRIAERLAASVRTEADPHLAAREMLTLVDEDELPLSEVSRAELMKVLEPLAEPALVATGTAGDQQRVAALSAQVAFLGTRLERAEEALKEAHEDRGLMHFLKASAHDLGLGIGWGYVYFIGFLVVWKGRTPGKKLFGIRVACIDGKPMTWWRSWERFNGYAASLITGLLGFAQVLWDPSRQCLHDKVAETVVVQDRD